MFLFALLNCNFSLGRHSAAPRKSMARPGPQIHDAAFRQSAAGPGSTRKSMALGALAALAPPPPPPGSGLDLTLKERVDAELLLDSERAFFLRGELRFRRWASVPFTWIFG